MSEAAIEKKLQPKQRVQKEMIIEGKETIQPGFRLVSSGNLFLALNRSHHFLLKKGQILIRQLEPNDSNFISILSIFQQCKAIISDSLSSSCLIKFWLFLTKNDDFYLKPKRNSRIVQAWDQAELSPWSQGRLKTNRRSTKVYKSIFQTWKLILVNQE